MVELTEVEENEVGGGCTLDPSKIQSSSYSIPYLEFEISPHNGNVILRYTVVYGKDKLKSINEDRNFRGEITKLYVNARDFRRGRKEVQISVVEGKNGILEKVHVYTITFRKGVN